jgi:hypothetical protein
MGIEVPTRDHRPASSRGTRRHPREQRIDPQPRVVTFLTPGIVVFGPVAGQEQDTSWEHDIVVEKVCEPEAKTQYPRCITGRRSCPPEDVGGLWGYSHFLDAIQHEDHPEHDDYREWIGDDFDPEAFDLEAGNQELQHLR